jgi:RimJ/RimL family protein N-acetyltransferase
MEIKQVIYGENIFLKTLDKSEISSEYMRWLNDKKINQYLEVRFNPPATLDELYDFIKNENLSDDSLMLGIFLNLSKKHIGNIKLGSINWRHRVGQIGILIGDQIEWGKGYASEAIDLITDYGFKNLNLAKITACCYASNEGSKHAFLKAGYAVEGVQFSQWDVNGKRQDGILLGRINACHVRESCING